MRIPRLYHPDTLTIGGQVALTESAMNHAVRVLRLSEGAAVILFNGQGGEYQGEIAHIQKRVTRVRVKAFNSQEVGSALDIHLGQVISRGERMDFTIQKAVELGVNAITPLFSERCEVKLQGDRLEKKMAHWQGIITHACEQSGRTTIPILHTPQTLALWASHDPASLKLTLDPLATQSIKTLIARVTSNTTIRLLIGAEGGLADKEILYAQQQGFIGIRLGPRILRTETAGLAALTVLQCMWGDMGL